MTPARSPLGAFYRSPLGVRRGNNRFAFMRHDIVTSTWSAGIASNGAGIVAVGHGLQDFPMANWATPGVWNRATINAVSMQSMTLLGKVVSVAHGDAGYIAMFSNNNLAVHFAISATGEQWDVEQISVVNMNSFPAKIWHGNGIYAALRDVMLVRNSSWAVITPTGDALDKFSMFVFHKKTSMFEAEESGLAHACYSSDCESWAASVTEGAHGFVDADYDATADKSLAVSIGSLGFSAGGYISADALSWTAIDSEPYHFCFAGGGKLFFGRPQYFFNDTDYVPGDYGPRLVMSEDGGLTWTVVTGSHDPDNGQYFNPHGGIYLRGKYYIHGRFGVDAGKIGSRVMVSSDGQNWQEVRGQLDFVY